MKFFKLLFSKAAIVAFTIVLQCAFILLQIYVFSIAFQWLQTTIYVLAIIIFFVIVNKNTYPDYKLPWLALMMFPFVGLVLYILFGNPKLKLKHSKRYKKIKVQIDDFAKSNSSFINEDIPQSIALQKQSGMPAFTNTDVKFFGDGTPFYESLLNDLKNATRFIFMEYFIIEEGEMWNGILDVLTQKVKEGVDVRIIYDDLGCVGKLKSNYYKKLRKLGIKCYKFNRFTPIISSIHNYRDHRKITVIDGQISYTGGLNLADEYVNYVSPYGYWKDTAVRLDGEATNSFTLMFLGNYAITAKCVEDFSPFLCAKPKEKDGLVQPFGDGPAQIYESNVGENAIVNMLNQAKKYVYMATPYLICDYTLLNAMHMACARGVKVKILVPDIPDKKMVYKITRSSFASLIENGVEIYQYTGAFVHSKLYLSDDEYAIVGTMNLDYRSLVHHYEDGVFLYNASCINDIKADFENSFSLSEKQTTKTVKQGYVTRLACAVMKIFTPLL